MATIVKRKKRYCVVYGYKDQNGKNRQKWETFDTNAAAKKRKAEIEYKQKTGEFVVPTITTVAALLEEYVSVYGVNNWALSTYEGKKGLMYNYIIPIIGNLKLDSLTPRIMDQFYQSLLSVRSKINKNRKPKSEFLTPHTIREIHKLLRGAFNQAVKWELMTRNPVLNATLPKEEHEKREIWTVETMVKALELCDDDILSLAINLSFSCSLRMGEMLALTWDCVDISEESVQNNTAFIFVNKEQQRVNIEALEALDHKDVIFIFPYTLSRGSTRLLHKAPKTKSSIRKVFLPRTVAYMLQQRKSQIEELKELFGDEYQDYNLVFAHPTGRPMEGQVINRALKKLIRENNLPDIVFHSFRHASITYKLKWNGGDIKSVQGDSGHARMDMVMNVYSHIIDEDRKFNAQKFEEQFYQAEGIRSAGSETVAVPLPTFDISIEELDPLALPMRDTEAEPPHQEEEITEEKNGEQNAELLMKLMQNPNMAELLKTLAKAL